MPTIQVSESNMIPSIYDKSANNKIKLPDKITRGKSVHVWVCIHQGIDRLLWNQCNINLSNSSFKT